MIGLPLLARSRAVTSRSWRYRSSPRGHRKPSRPKLYGRNAKTALWVSLLSYGPETCHLGTSRMVCPCAVVSALLSSFEEPCPRAVGRARLGGKEVAAPIADGRYRFEPRRRNPTQGDCHGNEHEGREPRTPLAGAALAAIQSLAKSVSSLIRHASTTRPARPDPRHWPNFA